MWINPFVSIYNKSERKTVIKRKKYTIINMFVIYNESIVYRLKMAGIIAVFRYTSICARKKVKSIQLQDNKKNTNEYFFQ